MKKRNFLGFPEEKKSNVGDKIKKKILINITLTLTF